MKAIFVGAVSAVKLATAPVHELTGDFKSYSEFVEMGTFGALSATDGLHEDTPRLVEFYSGTCATCSKLAPEYASLA